METKGSSAEIKPLTGLRGVAASWVVLYHVHGLDNISGPLGTLLRHGYMGVDIFFILSGFVMAAAYAGFFSGEWSSKKYTQFLIRRLARVYPLYLVTTCLIAVALLIGITKSMSLDHFGRAFVLNLLMIQAWVPATDTINGPAWSISSEFAAYLLFPLLAAVTIYARRPIMWTSVILCFLTIGIICVIPIDTQTGRHGPLDIYKFYILPWPVIRGIAGFTIGLGTYRLSQDPDVHKWMALPWVAWTVSLMLLIFFMIPNADLLIIALLPAFILTLTHSDSGVPRLMASPAVYFMGIISYSVYLLHMQFCRMRTIGDKVLSPHIGPFAADIISLSILYSSLVLCAWLTYLWIEKPARNKIRRFESL